MKTWMKTCIGVLTVRGTVVVEAELLKGMRITE